MEKLNTSTLKMTDIDLEISGMSCASCVLKVEKALLSVPNVIEAKVNLATEKARVSAPESDELDKSLIEAISKIGYHAKLINKSSRDQFKYKENKIEIDKKRRQNLNQQKLKVIISLILSIPLLIPMLTSLFGFQVNLSPFAQFLLATPVQFWLGAHFYRSSWTALQNRTGNMDLLISLGTTSAYGLSIYLWLFKHNHNNSSHLYFESSAVIITLVLLGKYFETKAKYKTTSALSALEALWPDKARLSTSNNIIEIPLEEVKPNDLLVVKPGEKIPLDGSIVEGYTFVDESLLTGESLPLEKKISDKVVGGSINTTGTITIKVTATGSETTLARIIRFVESAQASKAPIERKVDQISAIFVPTILIISLITILGWGILYQDWELALINGISVLVIACPCALGLATPTSIMVGTGVAAQLGILIKDAEALEIAHSATVLIFDKTGTLTEGNPRVSKFYVEDIKKENEALSIAASIQSGSEHPLAKAVLELAKEKRLDFKSAKNVHSLPGRGVHGIIDSDKILLGNDLLMYEKQINIQSFINIAQQAELEGETISYLANETTKKALALISFGDKPKNSSKATIERLTQLGIKSVMLTGDNEGSAKRIANKLGITEYKSKVRPEDKAKYVNEFKSRNEIVAMVGDGINDAPALASAHIGVAMSTGTDVAIQTAGIVLMRGDPILLPKALEISRLTYRKIKQNLFWAFIYNIIGIPLAAMGILNPMIAGSAMALSSVSVVTNSLLLTRVKR